MARWLFELHDRVAGDVIQLTQEALAQLLGVRRTTVTLTMNKLRGAGCIKSDREAELIACAVRSCHAKLAQT
ncbi:MULTISPECIES: helix-turn-helix domain-containing protein [unclassified Bradyrhizobium]|uniref:helix-turn-helix domain-containing protein n=1 Tax=unclassified Bradyrhizobium TaxID=2631580 RepID=UPI001FF2EFE3|nr:MULTISPECIES: helix-turn-helix domain-containing protein [unclassified Bradyrhizobium]MCJ9701965.1 helix-turn-helix domain-containing protein [Bradyrhizobium sp. SHOUNA76]MCJ9730603.1 helix-turn-helix domain-containing protein [Bradyrhizobium sp. PRIMUS42]